MADVGRPRALDEFKRREICALVSAGCGLSTAARYVGCSVRTIDREAERNPDFNEKIRRALLAAEVTPLQALRKAASTHWRAAAWMLERIDPDRYAKPNPALLHPDTLISIVQDLVDAIVDEVSDPEDQQRITESLQRASARVDNKIAKMVESKRDPFSSFDAHFPQDEEESQ